MSQPRPILKQLAAGLLALDTATTALVLAGPALAQPHPAFPPFPEVRSLPAIATWVRKNSDLPLATVVGIGSDSVFAVERSSEQPAPPAVRAVIRQEAITPDFAKRLGGRSASMLVDVDCEGRRVFQRGVDLYTGSNRQGPSRQLGAAKDWQAIPPGTFMERVMVAVCDPTWRAPYSDRAAARGVPAPAPQYAPPQYTVRPYAPVAQAAAPYVAPVEAAPLPPPPPPPTALPRTAPSPASSRGARVELGQYDSTDAALSFWRAADLASTGKRLRIELTTLAGRTRFRALVEGFVDHADAESFCRSVRDLGGVCSVVD